MKATASYNSQKKMLLNWIDDISIIQKHSKDLMAELDAREREVSMREQEVSAREACNVEKEAITDLKIQKLKSQRARLIKAAETVKELRMNYLQKKRAFSEAQYSNFGLDLNSQNAIFPSLLTTNEIYFPSFGFPDFGFPLPEKDEPQWENMFRSPSPAKDGEI